MELVGQSETEQPQAPVRYWTRWFPGEFGQHVQETWSGEQILDEYFPRWTENMVKAGKGDFVNERACIEDWIVVNWARETDSMGKVLDD